MDNKKEMQPGSVERNVVTPELVKPAELQPPVESWMQKIEKRFARVPNTTTDVTDDNVVVQQPQSQQPPVTLPVNHTQMQVGKTTPITEGITWLVSWVVRQIKILTRAGRSVRLQDMPEITIESNKVTELQSQKE